MKPVRPRVSSLAGALALMVLGPTLAASASDAPARKTTRLDPSVVRQTAVAAHPDFGITDYDVVTITAYDFHPFATVGAVTGLNSDDNSFIWATGGANMGFEASVPLPAGAIVDYIGLRYCDTTPNSGFTMDLDDIFADGSFNFAVTTTFSDLGGCNTVWNAVPAGYNWDYNSGHSMDLILFQVGPDVDGSVKFRGAEVWYKRKISPPPGSSTFGDVDMSDPAWPFIEAFVKAGITVGCQNPGDPLIYCPDSPVTRRQMAVFIAKALGLHFKN
ncbi:MAG TPA: hypothetical protein VGH97_10260 [Thermoanaerobaculia bacterium]|jgi:hypothetical protein